MQQGLALNGFEQRQTPCAGSCRVSHSPRCASGWHGSGRGSGRGCPALPPAQARHPAGGSLCAAGAQGPVHSLLSHTPSPGLAPLLPYSPCCSPSPVFHTAQRCAARSAPAQRPPCAPGSSGHHTQRMHVWRGQHTRGSMHGTVVPRSQAHERALNRKATQAGRTGRGAARWQLVAPRACWGPGAHPPFCSAQKTLGGPSGRRCLSYCPRSAHPP